MKEKIVTTAFNNNLASMLVDKLKNAGVPARVGAESSSTGYMGVETSRTVLVPEEYFKRAKVILDMD